jgi:enamine deaminase RidA (YjgF/YER057c/UK114 family)
MAIERINPQAIHEPRGYTHVIRASGAVTVHVSGQVGIRPDGSVAEGLGAQAIVAFENLGAALDAAGASPREVVKTTTYVVDYTPDDRASFVEARRRVLGDDVLPASTLLGVAALARPDLLIEVEAIAVIDE